MNTNYCCYSNVSCDTVALFEFVLQRLLHSQMLACACTTTVIVYVLSYQQSCEIAAINYVQPARGAGFVLSLRCVKLLEIDAHFH